MGGDYRTGGEAVAQGEAPIKQAIRWIEDHLCDDPAGDRIALVDRACREFDLSPLDAEFLLRHLAGRPRPS